MPDSDNTIVSTHTSQVLQSVLSLHKTVMFNRHSINIYLLKYHTHQKMLFSILREYLSIKIMVIQAINFISFWKFISKNLLFSRHLDSNQGHVEYRFQLQSTALPTELQRAILPAGLEPATSVYHIPTGIRFLTYFA